MRRAAHRIACLLVVLATGPVRAGAQDSTSGARVVMGLGLGIYRTNAIGGAAAGFGAAVGFERAVAPTLQLRGAVAVFKTYVDRDGAFACPPDPPCRIGVFHDELVSGELQSAVQLHRGVPLHVIGGLGITVPFGGHENWRRGPPADSAAGVRASFRAGLEVALGRSRSAPRLQLTRSGFSRSIYSLNWLDALFVFFPL
jgi:hypothetical protein